MSAKPVELIPLQCIKCEYPIPAETDEVAWACEQCTQGILLSTENELEPIEIHYAAGLVEGKQGKPFWVTEGRVSLRRETHKGNETQAMEAFWAQPRRFFIPAWQLPMEQMVQTGTRLVLNTPALEAGSPAPFLPVTTSQTDIQPLVEFIILSIEAERKDYLKALHIKLELSTPQLWILP
jgi:hypothetical protein